MASTNKTVNYELSQFEGTDKPSWEADYNADMLSIDTNLKAVSDVADGASGSISTLADRVTTAEGNISTNANDIDALEARADALEAGQTSDDSRLDALEAEQIVQNTAIEGNTQLAYNIARPYDSASTYNQGDFVIFQNTFYKCITAISTGEIFDPLKWVALKVSDVCINRASIHIDTYPAIAANSQGFFTYTYAGDFIPVGAKIIACTAAPVNHTATGGLIFNAMYDSTSKKFWISYSSNNAIAANTPNVFTVLVAFMRG